MNMIVTWFPYIRVTNGKYRCREVEVGPVTIWPDDESTWNDVVGRPRPGWLKVYRNWPTPSAASGEPCRGSVAVAAADRDPQFLADADQRVAAIIYFLGDVAATNGNPRRGRPAELLTRRAFEPPDEPTDDLALSRVLTKHAFHLESAANLSLTPPITLRGHLDRYKLDLNRPEHAELVARFTTNPQDRLVTACVHYFLTQYSDATTHPYEQDYANFCASLEAAYDVREKGDIWKVLYDGIKGDYGDMPDLERWVQGLYGCRSVHNHGLDVAAAEADPKEQAKVDAYKSFLSRRGNYTVCRSLCRDVILRRLRAAVDAKSGEAEQDKQMWMALGWTDDAGPILGRLLKSRQAWQRVRKLAKKNGSVDRLAAASGGDLDELREAIDEIGRDMTWQQAEPRHEDVGRALHILASARQKSRGADAPDDLEKDAHETANGGQPMRTITAADEWHSHGPPLIDDATRDQVLAAGINRLLTYFSHRIR